MRFAITSEDCTGKLYYHEYDNITRMIYATHRLIPVFLNQDPRFMYISGLDKHDSDTTSCKNNSARITLRPDFCDLVLIKKVVSSNFGDSIQIEVDGITNDTFDESSINTLFNSLLIVCNSNDPQFRSLYKMVYCIVYNLVCEIVEERVYTSCENCPFNVACLDKLPVCGNLQIFSRVLFYIAWYKIFGSKITNITRLY